MLTRCAGVLAADYSVGPLVDATYCGPARLLFPTSHLPGHNFGDSFGALWILLDLLVSLCETNRRHTTSCTADTLHLAFLLKKVFRRKGRMLSARAQVRRIHSLEGSAPTSTTVTSPSGQRRLHADHPTLCHTACT